jgi:hypothetical protein
MTEEINLILETATESMNGLVHLERILVITGKVSTPKC